MVSNPSKPSSTIAVILYAGVDGVNGSENSKVTEVIENEWFDVIFSRELQHLAVKTW